MNGIGSREPSVRKARTVLGDVPSNELGIILPHEHLIIDNTVWLRSASTTSDKPFASLEPALDNLWWMRQYPNMNRSVLELNDERTAVQEAAIFRQWGGRTIVDVTTIGLGRDPLALARIARRTGLNIVAGTGFYVEAAHPEWVRDADLDQIADFMIRELEVGIEHTGVRAGIIGEIGISDPLGTSEGMVLRAAAVVQRRTGAAISVHNAFTNPSTESALRAAEVLGEAGADMNRVVMGHMDPTSHRPDYIKRVLASGCYVEFDLFGHEYFESGIGFMAPGDSEKTDAVARLVAEGFRDRVLVSHDVCYKLQLCRYGGYGYAHLLRDMPDRFALSGVTAEDLMAIMTDNPRQLISLADVDV